MKITWPASRRAAVSSFTSAVIADILSLPSVMPTARQQQLWLDNACVFGVSRSRERYRKPWASATLYLVPPNKYSPFSSL